jgi:hypothetical protein
VDIELLTKLANLTWNVMGCMVLPLAGWAVLLVIRDLRRAGRNKREEEAQSWHGRKWPDPSRN